MILLKLRGEAPAALAAYKGSPTLCGWSVLDEIYRAWAGHPVEPYGAVIAGYGTLYPWSVPHVAVRLGLPGVAAFSVAALDEFADPLPAVLPRHPSYRGTLPVPCSPE